MAKAGAFSTTSLRSQSVSRPVCRRWMGAGRSTGHGPDRAGARRTGRWPRRSARAVLRPAPRTGRSSAGCRCCRRHRVNGDAAQFGVVACAMRGGEIVGTGGGQAGAVPQGLAGAFVFDHQDDVRKAARGLRPGRQGRAVRPERPARPARAAASRRGRARWRAPCRGHHHAGKRSDQPRVEQGFEDRVPVIGPACREARARAPGRICSCRSARASRG